MLKRGFGIWCPGVIIKIIKIAVVKMIGSSRLFLRIKLRVLKCYNLSFMKIDQRFAVFFQLKFQISGRRNFVRWPRNCHARTLDQIYLRVRLKVTFRARMRSSKVVDQLKIIGPKWFANLTSAGEANGGHLYIFSAASSGSSWWT